ncbi:hypothetical protein HGRIS_011846 [Hohenbuehelia grisea]|uniref:Domain of unknown function at the cortex 1 domain-containing protein n=1 Tax=Hohenbuehelia grisea TaxID=104357 RepID=A0ABR3JYJ2_9AGAR
MTRLRVLAGPSPESLVPITHLVNTSMPHLISSDVFEGRIVVGIKNLNGQGNGSSGYFDRNDRRDVTWSIQMQGRFLVPYSADDILFGNTFDKPLGLPWGSSAALKFMQYIDPTLEHDLTSGTHPGWPMRRRAMGIQSRQIANDIQQSHRQTLTRKACQNFRLMSRYKMTRPSCPRP